MKPDTISVRIIAETEIDADSADLDVVVEGGSVFSGTEAFKKAKELRGLIDALKDIGLDESRIKLRRVEMNSKSFALISASSAKYSITIKAVSLELLPTVMGALASQKGAKISRLTWNYSTLQETRGRLRREALAKAKIQASSDADVLGIKVLGIHQLFEEIRNRDYSSEYISADSADFGTRARQGQPEIAFSLGNATNVKVELHAVFRVGPFSE